MKVHLDADVLVYRAGFAAQKSYLEVTFEIGGARYTTRVPNKTALKAFLEEHGFIESNVEIEHKLDVEPEGNALYNARSVIRMTVEKLGVAPEDMILYLSGPRNFRTGLGTIKVYKGNRDPSHKPVHAAAIKAMLRREYTVVTSQEQEADDEIAIAHYAMWLKDPESSIIATTDKDLNMVPGWHYNFVKDERYYLSEDQCDYNFWAQMLTGDTVDNVSGVPGIGPVRAAELLSCDLSSRYGVVRAAYEAAYPGRGDEVLIENGRLLWMRRKPDEWWVPPSTTSTPSTSVPESKSSTERSSEPLPSSDT